MKHLLSGTALAAALAIATPAWAQTLTTTNPAGTPSTTAPAPYTQSAPSSASQTAPSSASQTAPSTTMQTAPSTTAQTAAPSAQQAPAQPTSPSASAPASSSTTAAATEPKAKRHVVRHASHMRSMHRVRHAPLARRGSRAPSDNIAAQLNRQELGRLSGSSMRAATQGYSQPGQPPSSSGR